MTQQVITAEQYALNLSTQLRKGFLAFCALKICNAKPLYTSDIINKLREVEMVVVEGTIYPLLSRLQKEGLLEHEWRESELGPPRKYYKITNYGKEVMIHVEKSIDTLNATIGKL